MLCSDDITLKVINFSNSHVHEQVQGDGLRDGVLITTFYGMPNTSKRAESWGLLTRINQDID